MTIMLTPFISCSAKIPIYAVFTAAFFEKYQALVMIALICWWNGNGNSGGTFIQAFTLFRGKPMPFVHGASELSAAIFKERGTPDVGQGKGLHYREHLQSSFLATIIIWFLQSFDTRLNVVSDSADSLLALIGRVDCTSFCSAWIWGLESIHFFDLPDLLQKKQ